MRCQATLLGLLLLTAVAAVHGFGFRTLDVTPSSGGGSTSSSSVPQVFDDCSSEQWQALQGRGKFVDADGNYNLPCDDSNANGVRAVKATTWKLENDPSCPLFLLPPRVPFQGVGTMTTHTRLVEVLQDDGSWQLRCLPEVVSFAQTARVCGETLQAGAVAKTEAEYGTTPGTLTYRAPPQDAFEATIDAATLDQVGRVTVDKQDKCLFMADIAGGTAFTFDGARVARDWDSCDAANWAAFPGIPLCWNDFFVDEFKFQATKPDKACTELDAQGLSDHQELQGSWVAAAAVLHVWDDSTGAERCVAEPVSAGDANVQMCRSGGSDYLSIGEISVRRFATSDYVGMPSTYGTLDIIVTSDNSWSLKIDSPFGNKRCYPVVRKDGHFILYQWGFSDERLIYYTSRGGSGSGGSGGGSSECKPVPNVWQYRGQIVTDAPCEGCRTLTVRGRTMYVMGSPSELHMHPVDASCPSTPQ